MATSGGASSEVFGGPAFGEDSVCRNVFGDVAGLIVDAESTFADERKGELSFLMDLGETGGGDLCAADVSLAIGALGVTEGDGPGFGTFRKIAFNASDDVLMSSEGRLDSLTLSFAPKPLMSASLASSASADSPLVVTTI